METFFSVVVACIECRKRGRGREGEIEREREREREREGDKEHALPMLMRG